MEKHLKELLIEAGTKEGSSFEPKDDSEEEYKKFLAVIDNLERLASDNYIQILSKHKSSKTGKYDTILIRLTYEGREWLVQNRHLE